jgi:hypothetical protein
VLLLLHGNAPGKANSANALASLAKNDAHRGPIIAAIGPLVSLLQHGNAGGKANSALALADLVSDDKHVGPIVAAGAIGPLVALLQHGDAARKVSARLAPGRLDALPQTAVSRRARSNFSWKA